jgi:S-adenosylmethionine decarboxylase
LAKGRHIIVDISNQSGNVCGNDKLLSEILTDACLEAGANIICSSRYRFESDSPPGCTVFLMLDESHVSIHTYSLEGKIALDVFTCGSRVNADAILNTILEALNADRPRITEIDRF